MPIVPIPSDEFEVVRLAARAELPSERAAALRQSVHEGLDWDEILRAGTYHKVLPLLFAHLRGHDAVPERVAAALRNQTWWGSAHVLFLSSEMAQISGRLSEAGVPFLILKGPSLAAAYGGVAKRPFVDNDLLIRREDFGRTEEALLSLGFNERKRSARQQSGYLSVHGEYTFGRAVSAFVSTVDVHTRLVPMGFSYAPSFDELLERSRALGIAGATVRVLSWDDLFLALSVNALKDQWDRLRLAVDLSEVAPLVTGWPDVMARAARDRVVRVVHLAILVAADELGADFPPDVLAQARQDRHAAHLSERVRSGFAGGREGVILSGTERVRLHLLAQDGLRGRLRYSGYAAVRRVTERMFDPRR